MSKSIYELELHEETIVSFRNVTKEVLNNIKVMRVASGFIYEYPPLDDQDISRNVFVPYEFKKENKRMFTREEIYIAVKNMENDGGGFIQRLAALINKADLNNLNKIVEAFNDQIEEYLNFNKRKQ